MWALDPLASLRGHCLLGVNLRDHCLDGKLGVLANEWHILGRHDHDSTAALASTAGSSNTMDVLVLVGSEADLDDQTNVGEIHATADHVRGEEQAVRGGLELLDSPVPRRLPHAGVHLVDGQFARCGTTGEAEDVVHETCLAGGRAEDDGLERRVVQSLACQQVVKGGQDIVDGVDRDD